MWHLTNCPPLLENMAVLEAVAAPVVAHTTVADTVVTVVAVLDIRQAQQRGAQ
jgi:hypothetical protein